MAHSGGLASITIRARCQPLRHHHARAPTATSPPFCASPTRAADRAWCSIQEIFGVNGYIRDVAERLAGEGYVALAPHMYWRIQDDFAVEATGPDDLPMAFAVAGQHDPDDGVADVGAALVAPGRSSRGRWSRRGHGLLLRRVDGLPRRRGPRPAPARCRTTAR